MRSAAWRRGEFVEQAYCPAVAIELSTELIGLQEAADAARLAVLNVQERFGPPMQGEGWTEEQHAEWDAAWKAWRDAAEEVQAATPDRETEAALKKRVRHPEPEAEAA